MMMINQETERKQVTVKAIMCECLNTYQDKRYGRGKRLHNRLSQKSGSGHRCTVCGKVKTTMR